jgi:hypothetical protein
MSQNPSDSQQQQITRLLLDWRGGDRQALDALTPWVYNELRRLAEHYLRDERSAATLQPTALVHDPIGKAGRTSSASPRI